MTRWIDMTDAQKGALHQSLKAKERAKILANSDCIIKALDRIKSEAAEILTEGGKYAESRAARWIAEEQKPYFDRLTRLNINPSDIGIEK